MIRAFLYVVAAGVLLGLVGLAYLGMFPPRPVEHHVVTVLPAGKFAAH
ncbi:MAG: hypothetical protein KGI51_11890 [Rhodospirillales bacterium]|nr:hypothetical protein [Rhodospirillales bacterium]